MFYTFLGSFIISAFTSNFYTLFLTLGVMAGASESFVFVGGASILYSYFTDKKGLATSKNAKRYCNFTDIMPQNIKKNQVVKVSPGGSSRSLSRPLSHSLSRPISLPVSPPVLPPVLLPVSPPVSLPVWLPVSPPVSLPVSLPVSPPVLLPVSPPVSPPVLLPVSLPVSPPLMPCSLMVVGTLNCSILVGTLKPRQGARQGVRQGPRQGARSWWWRP